MFELRYIASKLFMSFVWFVWETQMSKNFKKCNTRFYTEDENGNAAQG